MVIFDPLKVKVITLNVEFYNVERLIHSLNMFSKKKRSNNID